GDRGGDQPAAKHPRPRLQAALRAPGRREPADLRDPRHPPEGAAGFVQALPGELLPQALQAGGHPGADAVPRGRQPVRRQEERTDRATGRAQAPADAPRQARQVSAIPAAAEITLGLLAGGRGSRLGGVDKAWIERDGQPQVLRLARRFPGEVGAVLVSANRELARYADAGLQAVPDRLPPDSGPLAGIEALAAACRTPWLLTLPVDLFDTNDCLVRTLVSCRDADGAVAEDADGLQPLVALYRVEALRAALPAALAAG